MPRIFLSHASADGRQAAALKKWLTDQDPGLRKQIFLDIAHDVGMVGGEQWEDTIRRNLAGCRSLLILLSERWEASKECYWEYRDAEKNGKTIYCARLEETAGTGLISRFQRRELYVVGDEPTTAIDLDDGKPPVVFSTDGLKRLLGDVGTQRLGADSFAWPPPQQPRRAPYRGWLPFESVDAAVFFGRDSEVKSALNAFEEIHAVGSSRLFVILGPSGTGKSSFLRAGVLPRLAMDPDRFLAMDIVRPGRDETLTGDLGLAGAIHRLREHLGLDEPSLGELKAEWIHRSDKVRELLIECQQRASTGQVSPMLVLPVDQAEELFSAESGPEAKALLRLAHDLLAGEPKDTGRQPLRVIVAATIRTDRYEVMQTAEELAGVDTVLFNDLKPMRADRFRQVIEGPARRSTEGGRPLSVEPQLVDRLLNDATANTTASGDTLPLLSGTLYRLYADYGAKGELTLAQYNQLGGISRVVGAEIDKILSADKSVRAEQLAALREAFIPWLATVSDTDEPLRRIALWRDLPPSSIDMVEKLVDARILIRDRRELGDGHAGQQDVVEIALESFLRQWDELAGWLREQREDLKLADEILRDATRWRTSDQDPAYLYPTGLLEKAEALSATATFSRKLEPTREFLVASRQRVSEEQTEKEATLRRNTIRLAMVLAVAVVVALAAVGAFFWANHSQQVAKRNAQDATAQKLVAEAQARLDDSSEGEDYLALEELLAAGKLASQYNERPLLDALVDRAGLVKVLRVPKPVVGVAFADEGHRLAMAQPDEGIRVWDTSAPDWQQSLSAQSGRHLEGGSAKLTSLAISRDGRLVVAGNESGVVQSWDLGTEEPTATAVGHPHEGRVTSVAISRDGRTASAGADGVVDITGPSGGPSDSPPMKFDGAVFSVAFNPSGDRLAVGTADGQIRLIDVRGSKPVELLAKSAAHVDGVMSIAFSPDGKYLATGGADRMVQLWDAATMTPVRSMPGHTATVTAVAFNDDGSRIASVSNDKTVRLWDVATGNRIGDPMRGHGGLVLTVDFVSDGDVIVSGGNEHTMRLWDGVQGQPLSETVSARSGPVTDVAISADGHEIASVGTDRTVRLWSADTGLPVESTSPHSGLVTSVAFSPADRMVASAGADGRVALWRPGTRQAARKYDAGRPLTSVAFNSTGSLVAAGGIDGQIVVWNVASGRKMLLENRDGAMVTAVAFDPNSDRLASVSLSGLLRMWNPVDGQQVWEAKAAGATNTKSEVQLSANHPISLFAVAFAPDGGRVAVGGAAWTAGGGQIGLFALFNGDGSAAGEPIETSLAVMDIAFDRQDNGSVVVASFDPYEVQLWDIDSPTEPRFTYTGHEAQVVSVALSSDGRRIASGSADGSVRVWPNLPTGPAEQAVCAKLTTREMSEESWHTNVSVEIPRQPLCPEHEAASARPN